MKSGVARDRLAVADWKAAFDPEAWRGPSPNPNRAKTAQKEG